MEVINMKLFQKLNNYCNRKLILFVACIAIAAGITIPDVLATFHKNTEEETVDRKLESLLLGSKSKIISREQEESAKYFKEIEYVEVDEEIIKEMENEKKEIIKQKIKNKERDPKQFYKNELEIAIGKMSEEESVLEGANKKYKYAEAALSKVVEKYGDDIVEFSSKNNKNFADIIVRIAMESQGNMGCVGNNVKIDENSGEEFVASVDVGLIQKNFAIVSNPENLKKITKADILNGTVSLYKTRFLNEDNKYETININKLFSDVDYNLRVLAGVDRSKKLMLEEKGLEVSEFNIVKAYNSFSENGEKYAEGVNAMTMHYFGQDLKMLNPGEYIANDSYTSIDVNSGDVVKINYDEDAEISIIEPAYKSLGKEIVTLNPISENIK